MMPSPSRSGLWDQPPAGNAAGHQRGTSASSIQMMNTTSNGWAPTPSGLGAAPMHGGGGGAAPAASAGPSGLWNNNNTVNPAAVGGQPAGMMMNPGVGMNNNSNGAPMMMPQQQQQQQWVMGPNGQMMPAYGGMMMGGPGMYGGQGMYGQQQPGCCSDAQNPNQQQGMFSSCCPADPTVHICDTSFRTDNSPQTSALNCLWGYCDATTWSVVFFFFMSVIGFAISLGTSKVDDLFAVYGSSNSAELELKVFSSGLTAVDPASFVGVVESEARCKQLCWLHNKSEPAAQILPYTPAPPSANASAPTPSPDATAASGILPEGVKRTADGVCPMPGAVSDMLTGTIGGAFCEYHQLSVGAMLVNLSRWNNFRGTLYFIAMMGSLILLVLVIIVNRHKLTVAHHGQLPPMTPPYDFWKTNFYYMFRFAWGTVSVVIFLWVATEMYQYWWFKDVYIGNSRGALRDFWVGYDKKFVATVICVTIFLSWPLIQLVASAGVFVGFIVPWMCFKNMCYPQINMLQFTPERISKHEDDWSFCVSAEMFFSQYRQVGRLGFSQGMWELMTGTTEPYTSCDQQQGPGMFPPGGMTPQMMEFMRQQQMQQQQGAGGAPPGVSVTAPSGMHAVNGPVGAAGLNPSMNMSINTAPPPLASGSVGRSLSMNNAGPINNASTADMFARSGNFAPGLSASASRGMWSENEANSVVDGTGGSQSGERRSKSEKSKSEKPKKEKSDKTGEKREKRDKSRDKRDKSGGGAGGGDSGMPGSYN